jgi:membrane protease YdiL (CAAX protease family)
MTIIYLYLPIAFVLLHTLLHYKKLKKKTDDFRAAISYFLTFFLLLLGIPLLIILFSGNSLKPFLGLVGFSWGNTSAGLILIATGIPLTLLAAVLGCRDPELARFYPLSKLACQNPKHFILYELLYLVFYYFTWEFVFRGLLFFPLLNQVGLPLALSIQTIISTLYHIGHPDKEILGALAGGYIYGLAALASGSFFYTFFLHALLGISTDTILCFRHHGKEKQRKG